MFMAKIYTQSLFSWKEIDDLGDLERLKVILDTMPDEKLMRVLEKQRGYGRDDYPIRATWNSVLSGIVFQHKSIESMQRELLRNAQLRELCGFDPLKGGDAVPTSSAYSRFLTNLLEHGTLINEIFDDLVNQLRDRLEGFGEELAFDGKAIHSAAKGKKKKDNDRQNKKEDRRRDDDADWGVKTYRGVSEDGTLWEKTKSWFGYRLHLIIDAVYELPVAFELTKASPNEQPIMREMFDELAGKHPQIIEDCNHAMGDKGYDNTEMVSKLWDKYKIKPVIDIRNNWKDSDVTRTLKTREVKNVTYDYKGTVFCHCPETGEIRKMAFSGFEKDRNTLKYVCPALQYGIDCKGSATCPVRKGIRIPLEEDRRIFTPVARSSYKWKVLYNKRTSVERVNSRVDLLFGFEKHFIRGLVKMRVRCGLSLCVMLALALGRAQQNRLELMRSLTKAA